MTHYIRIDGSLALANDLNTRIHGTEEDLLFVYHPIFLEFPSEEGESYIIDWSSKEVNQRIQDYLVKRQSDEKPLHVFVLPQSKVSWTIFDGRKDLSQLVWQKYWCYVGAHRICVTRDPCQIWERLSNSVKCWLSEFLRCTEMR